MSFRGHSYAFSSPAEAIAGMLAALDVGTGSIPPERLGVEAVPLRLSIGRVLAENISADRDSPAFDYAAMDGYAVRSSDLRQYGAGESPNPGVTMEVSGECRIGQEPPPMPHFIPGGADAPEALRIVTGAAIPDGADAVIKREDVLEHASPCSGDGVGVRAISISGAACAAVKAGAHIRRRGENARCGSVVQEAGAVLTAAAAGTLAAVGVTHPRVHARLRVAIITTGDELISPDATPSRFQIRDSNTEGLTALLGTRSWIEVVLSAHVGDQPGALSALLRSQISAVDAIVLSGGVSMGHRDPVRGAVEEIGARIIFHGLPQRPGKPMLAATAMGGRGSRVPIFGLPGNPVSALITCRRIVLPVLEALAGVKQRSIAPRLMLATNDGAALDLWWHRLVRVNDTGQAEFIEGKGSGDIVAIGASDGFAEIPPRIVEGACTESQPWSTYSFYSWNA